MTREKDVLHLEVPSAGQNCAWYDLFYCWRPAMEQRPPFYPQAQPMSQPPVSYPSMPQLGYQNSIQGPPVSYGQPNYQNLPPPPSPPQRNYAAAYTPTYPGPQSAAGQITPEISPQRPQSNSGVQAPAALNGLPAFLSQLVDAGIIPPSGPSAAALSVTTPTESVPLTFSNFNRQVNPVLLAPPDLSANSCCRAWRRFIR